jgi:pentatricopeptide repeat domain-containing protein 1
MLTSYEPVFAPSRPANKQPRYANKGCRRLWEQVKTVGKGHLISSGTRSSAEWSVEEIVRLVVSLPASACVVTTVAPALHHLDSRAAAALLKELARARQLPRALEIFQWLRSLEPHHPLSSLADVYTFTTAVSLMGQAQQLRGALELVADMRSRGHACNVHTYSALMNVCVKVSQLLH